MNLLLLGVLIALAPSALMVGWLVWQTSGVEDRSGFDLD